MNDETIKLPIRTALIPNYYQNFHCLASECRDSCCIDWRITFNKKDYLRLRRLDAPPELKARLKTGVRRERKADRSGAPYGKFDLDSNEGRCPFLDPDGLCSIQRSCGHEALPYVCTSYPRKFDHTAAAKEYTLSPSCEGVLQQLWDLPDGIEFVEELLPKAEWRTMNITPGDTLSASFTPIRALCIDILQNRSMNLSQRMIHLGIVLQRLQNEDRDYFDAELWMAHQQALLASAPTGAEIPVNTDMFLLQNIKVLDRIGSKNTWVSEICDSLEVTHRTTLVPKEGGEREFQVMQNTRCSKDAYEDALSRFQAKFADREYFFEDLMVAAALFLAFPNLNSKEELWKSYVSLCSLYSLYRFVSVSSCKQGATKERLFHAIVMASRSTLHNKDRFDGFQEELFQHDSSTMAHMAILLGG